MNNIRISSYEDLCREKERLTELLKQQKTVIQKDFENLKEEFHPVVNLSDNISKLLSREDGKDPLFTAGTNLTIDILVAKLLGKSNFLLKLILPPLLKNFTSHYMPKAPLHKNGKATLQVKSPAQKVPAVNPALREPEKQSLYKQHA